MKHTAINPFPTQNAKGETITGELCDCGHFRSEHHDTIAYGHGACAHCDCGKYTWTAFVKAPRKAK